MRSLVLMAAAVALPYSLSAAVACGDTVSGEVTLTSDLVCNSQNGLIVGADHTTIDLNGFSIRCEGSGLGGSCQKIIGPSSQPEPATSYVGIASTQKSKVRIKGPGSISGFGVGVRVTGGQDVRVEELTVTGPSQPAAATNQRLITPGILVFATACAGGDSVTIRDNEVTNQTVGVSLQLTQCVTVRDNYIHDNNSRFGDSHGIAVIGSKNNNIIRNVVERNGANRLTSISDSGIQLLNGFNGDTSGNEVSRNIVNDNCGDGIAAVNGANLNTIERNSVRFNGDNAFGGQCLVAAPGTFFDLAERQAGAGNFWSSNNQCRTNSATVPGGVCGPLE